MSLERNGDVHVFLYEHDGQTHVSVSFCVPAAGTVQVGANMIMSMTDAMVLRDMLNKVFSAHAQQEQVAA